MSIERPSRARLDFSNFTICLLVYLLAVINFIQSRVADFAGEFLQLLVLAGSKTLFVFFEELGNEGLGLRILLLASCSFFLHLQFKKGLYELRICLKSQIEMLKLINFLFLVNFLINSYHLLVPIA